MITPQMIEYIKAAIASGQSRETVTLSLVQNGWSTLDINDAFASIAGFLSVPQPTQSAQPTAAGTQSGDGRLISVGQLFLGSWDLYKQRLPVLLILLAIPSVFLWIGSLFYPVGSIQGSIFSLIGLVIFIPTVAAAFLVIAKGIGFLDSLKRGVQLFFPLLWVGILSELVIIGGTVMFIIPGIMMVVWFFLSLFVLVVEDKRGLNALLQSHEYVRGYWWAIFGRLLLVYAIIFIPMFVAQSLVSLVLGKTSGMIAYYILMILATPFSLAYSYKLYESLTILKPALATTTPTSGRGFLIASAILGLIAPAIIFIGVVTLLVGKANISTAPSSLPITATRSVIMLAATPYTNMAAGYHITPPAGWKVQNTVSDGKDNETFSKRAPNPSQANITIIAAQNTNTAINTRAELDVEVRKIIAVYQGALPNFKLLSNTDSSVGPVPAAIFLFTSENSSGVSIETLVFFTVEGDHLYEVVAQATAEDWSIYEGLFRSVIASFSFTS